VPNPDERHYNPKKLTVLFAISSVLLLGSVVWMLLDDYIRPWKDTQREFRALEIENTRIQFDAENTALEKDSEYQKLSQQLEEAQKKFKRDCPDYSNIEKKIAELKAADDLAQQQYKFTKAELDAAKYRFEEASTHQAPDLKQVTQEYEHLEQQVNELMLKAEASQQRLSDQNNRLNSCQEQVKQLERQSRQISSRRDLLMRKLSGIDPNEMNFTNRIATMVRDLPILDLANPNYKIEQIVLKDIHEDVNFMTVPKVDRCISCHLGISDPDYKNAAQPFKTHPNLDLYVGKDSPHSMEELGCTVCHGGRGRSTSFNGAAHTPADEEQKKQWQKDYNWHRFELWEEPMLPLKYVEAGCFKCHSGQSTVKGAEKLNLGVQIIETAGCYGCHLIDKYADWPKPGPNLQHIKSKLSKEWAFKWVKNPHAFRSDTWMPAFFGQTNNNDPESIQRSDQEILAMVHYLFENSTEYESRALPVKGDASRGEEVVESVGCMACHEAHPAPTEKEQLTREHLRQEFGPNLFGLGSKTSKEWIFSWLKDPKSYHKATRMPNLRLTDQEAADIAEYLYQNRVSDFEGQTVPAVDLTVLDKIVSDHLIKNQTHDQAKQKLTMMTQDEKLHFAGQKLIQHYGCYGCHNISGFESIKPIGTELTYEGSKNIHNLDFAFIHIDHTKWAFFDQKLKDPRIFDKGKVKLPDEKLKMPNYYLSQNEVDAIVTAILGFVETHTIEKNKSEDPRAQTINEGQRIVRQFNCQGCHIIEGEGGTIQESVQQWLVDYDGRAENEAQAMVNSFSPPNLIGEGQKVHAQWLFEFLHKPTTIRPWLKVRMPSYEFNGEHLNTLVKYFNALDNSEFPFVEEIDTSMTPEQFQLAEKLFSKDYFGCASCHIVGNQIPGGSPDSWAPNFALSKTRLKPGWISEWIKNPQKHLPGTKMPTYFDPANFESAGPEDLLNGDENEQIRYLRNYLMTLTDKPSSAKQEAAPPASAQEAPQK